GGRVPRGLLAHEKRKNGTFVLSSLRGPLRHYCRSDDGNFLAAWNNLEYVALKGAHLDHFLHVNVQQSEIELPGVRAGDVELAWAVHVNARRGGGGQCAVPQPDEVITALVAGARSREDLFGLHVQEPEAHGPVPHDPLEVTRTPAAAECLLRVEADHRMAPLPDA